MHASLYRMFELFYTSQYDAKHHLLLTGISFPSTSKAFTSAALSLRSESPRQFNPRIFRGLGGLPPSESYSWLPSRSMACAPGPATRTCLLQALHAHSLPRPIPLGCCPGLRAASLTHPLLCRHSLASTQVNTVHLEDAVYACVHRVALAELGHLEEHGSNMRAPLIHLIHVRKSEGE